MAPDITTFDQGRPTWLRLEATIAWRMIVITAAALLAIWLVLQVTVIAVAAFIGFAQAALLWPVVQWLDRFLPRALAALAVVAVYAAAVLALAWFILVQMVDAWPELFSALVGSLESANNWFVDHGWSLPPEMIDDLQSQLQSRAGEVASGIGGAALTTLSILGSASTIIVVALFGTLFGLIGGKQMTQAIVRMVPAPRQLSTFAAIRDSATTARWWTFASTVTGAVDGLLIGLGMWGLGVPLAVPIGLATFILAYIPMIGATIAGALAVAIALFFGGLPSAVATLVLVLAVQQIEGNVLSPLLMSRAMQFPPLLTLLLSTGAGIALGLPGLFLAVPVAGILTAAVRAWRREIPEDERAARGIVDRPSPDFDELGARAAPRDDPTPGEEAAEEPRGQTPDDSSPDSTDRADTDQAGSGHGDATPVAHPAR